MDTRRIQLLRERSVVQEKKNEQDWTPFPLRIDAATMAPAIGVADISNSFRIKDNHVEVICSLSQRTLGAPGLGTYFFNIPEGLQIADDQSPCDTITLPDGLTSMTGSQKPICGTGVVLVRGQRSVPVTVVLYKPAILLGYWDDNANYFALVSASNQSLNNSIIQYDFQYRLKLVNR